MNVKSCVFSGCVIEDEVEMSLAELSQACCVTAEWLIALVEEGILEPLVDERHWRFGGASVYRARAVQRLQRDLGVNVAGAALALELLAEIDTLRMRLAVLESGGSEVS
ncbi:MAG: MerR family transcriptional regulator [Gammaproteobacteria bacterium]|nr:MerR family transcriptional regulator [Gammaproteobacteria bacterium]